MSFAPLVLIFVVFYFLLIRPQQKRMKQHKEMLGSIRRGDRIVTTGGIIGTVNKIVNNDELILEIADGVRVRVMRGMVSSVVAKTEPADADEDETASTSKQ
jgi:preprotein translocase subunit YajC